MAFNILIPVLAVLMVDAVIEVGFLGSMVGYLHIAHHDVPFQINSAQGSFELYSKPAQLLVNQGHTSNGAAGTAFVLVGVVGYLVLWYQRRRERSNTTHGASGIFLAWTVCTVLSFLLTLSALIYTFVVTHQTDNQTINTSVAAANQGKPYPEDQWTPENWYKQLLKLQFADQSQKGDIRTHLRLMEGWRWNLIPLVILGASTMSLAIMQCFRDRRRGNNRDSTGSSWLQKPSPRV